MDWIVPRLRNRQIRHALKSLDGKSVREISNSIGRLNKRVLKYPIEISSTFDCALLRVADRDGEFFLSRPSRIHHYSEGIRSREVRLRNEYMLDQIPIDQGSLIIDVGANIGEVSKLWGKKGASIIAVEPELREQCALRKNLEFFDLTLVEQPVWCNASKLVLFSKNDSGDSSLLEIEGARSERTVFTTTLNELYHKYGDQRRVRALKLEAEGAEPEILEGAREMLQMVDFITVDVGAERGVANANTLIPVLNTLLDFGFSAIDYEHKRGVLLMSQARKSY